MRKLVFLAILLIATCFAASAATWLTEMFESGQNGWTALNGSYVAAAAPVPHGLSFKNAVGSTTRISKGFTGSGTKYILKFNFYDSSVATNTTRSFGGFAQNAAAPATNGALFRLGNNNQAKYQVHYWTTALQTIDTGITRSVGWHSVTLIMDTAAKTLQWKLDNTTSALISNPNILAPNCVVLGYNYSNGTGTTPDVSVYYDEIEVGDGVIPEPSSMLALGSGLLGLLGILRRRR